ncbi:MAG: ATP-binding protein [Holophagaceae bacterium]|nr:ATP-binding protein [Holophagaceae bacterium]
MPFLNQRSIAAQVRVALGLLALLMLLASLGMLVLARRAARQASDVYRDHLQPMIWLMDVSEAYSVDITISFRMVRAGRMAPEEGLRRLREGEAKARRNWAAFRSKRAATPAILETEEELARLEKVGEQLAVMLPGGMMSKELGIFGDHQWLPEVLNCSRILAHLRAEEDRRAESTIQALELSSWRTTLGGLALMLASLVLALGLGQGFAAHLRKGVNSLVARLRSVADGNLEPAPVAPGGSELASAERALNRTVAHLRQLITENQAQKALERAILDGARAMIIGLDLEGRVSRWNHAAEQLLGYRADEVIGRATPELWRLPEELAALAVEIGERVGRNLAPGPETLQVAATIPGFATECHFKAKDGSLIPVLLTISQVRGPEGALLGTMGVALDLRDLDRLRKELRASEDRYRLLAERLPDVVYQSQIWPDGRRAWPFISPQFHSFYGVEPAALERDPDYSLNKLHPEDRPGFLACLEEATTRMGPLTWEGRTFTERPGELKWVRVRRSPTLQPDGSILWDGVTEDITRLKQSAEALRLSEARALEASRAKSAFLASMSHELRTPLSAILGYSRLMARDLGRSEEDRVQLEHVLRAGEHLLSLINDVLSLSKIEAGRMELRPAAFAPVGLVRELEALFRLSAQSKGLAFEIEARGLPDLVEGDQPKLRQVLVNLLGNALKFTAHGTVRLTVSWRGGIGAFRVEDTGPGIPVEEQVQIFAAFHQTALGHTSGGTGLGLHISQALVALMGGQVRIDSLPGRGSRFDFEIPLPEPEGPVILPSRGRVVRLAAGEAPRKLLIVDDRVENRDMLDRLLRLVGFHCSLAEHGAAGLEQWREGHPDLILMDLRMPVLDGFGAVEQLRRLEGELGRARTPVLAISASVYDVSTEDLIRRGFDAFLTKPIDEEQLFASLEDLLGVRFERSTLAGEAGPAPLDALAHQHPDWQARFLDQVASGDLEAAESLLRELTDSGLAEATRAALRAYNLEDILKQLR